MVKTKLMMEQLVAGALLSFEKISSVDISLLVKDFARKYPDYEFVDLNWNYLKDLVAFDDDNISLKDGSDLNSYVSANESKLKKRLEEIAGSRVRKYFQELDLEEFMLRKIAYYSSIKEDNLDNLFCNSQQEMLKKLNDKHYLSTIWNDDTLWDDYREIRLSNLGKLRLFKIDYAKEIKEFVERLKSMRYDVSLLDDFLIKQDLDMPVGAILSLEKLKSFCNCYDRAMTEDGVSEINFMKLASDKKTILDDSGKDLMENMLAVWDSHCIHICHPNHLFAGAKALTPDVREMVNINWDDIDIERMLRIGDYKAFSSPNISQAFRYVHKCLGDQVMNMNKKGLKKEAVGYLAVVEKYQFDGEDNYLVRGIIRGDHEGYSLAFNPEFQKTIPQSLWEKSLRFSDQETPSAYLVKRKSANS